MRLDCEGVEIQTMAEQGQSSQPLRSDGVELNPMELMSWIESRPELYYIREAADRVQARYDAEKDEITFQAPSRRLVRDREANWRYRFKEFIFPGARSIRGTSCASQEFDQTCRNTAGLMSLSTLWDGVSTYPIIQYGFSTYLGAASIPGAIGISAIILAASNKSGQESCNRSKGKKISSKFALASFLALSAIKTLMSGVGMEILVNPTGITKGYAQELAKEQVLDTEKQLDALRTFKNPKYVEFKKSCDSLRDQLKGVPRTDPLWNSLYVLAYGEYKERLANQGLTPEQILKKYGGTVNNIPGDCNKQRIQLAIDSKSADQLSNRLQKWRTEIDMMPSLMFLEKNFPDLYRDNFRQDGDRVLISDGGDMVRSASLQFYQKLGDGKEIWSLGFSLVWMLVSIILSVGAVFLLWSKSKLEDMKMSYSNDILAERSKFLDGYRESLERFQQVRRERLFNSKNGGQSS